MTVKENSRKIQSKEKQEKNTVKEGDMLALTRKIGETVIIDGDITVQVVQVRGRQVRLGIAAPKDKTVQRGELIQSLPPSSHRPAKALLLRGKSPVSKNCL